MPTITDKESNDNTQQHNSQQETVAAAVCLCVLHVCVRVCVLHVCVCVYVCARACVHRFINPRYGMVHEQHTQYFC